MYHLMDLIGKVVTVKNTRGDELIATLAGVNEEKTILTLHNVMQVAVSDNQTVLIPYLYTATAEVLFVSVTQVFVITATLQDAAADYLELVSEKTTTDDAGSEA
jgi:cadmium resistance protein CadD (predicted permease)